MRHGLRDPQAARFSEGSAGRGPAERRNRPGRGSAACRLAAAAALLNPQAQVNAPPSPPHEPAHPEDDENIVDTSFNTTFDSTLDNSQA